MQATLKVSKFSWYGYILCFIEGLNEPFDEGAHDCRCLLDYLKKCKGRNIMSYYVRNFLEVAKQIFSALEYFEREGLVHRDIKRKL